MNPTPPQAPDKAGVVERLKGYARRNLTAARQLRDSAAGRGVDTKAFLYDEGVELAEQFVRDIDALAALSPPPVVEEPGLRAALDDLQQAEAEYRLMHDRHGDGAMASGRAWDRMRRAGDKARSLLNRAPTAGEEAVERLLKAVEALFAGGFVQAGLRGTRSQWKSEFYERTEVLHRAMLSAREQRLPSPRVLTIPDELRELSEKATVGWWAYENGDLRAGPGDGNWSTPIDEEDWDFAAAAVNFIRQALSDQEPSHGK